MDEGEADSGIEMAAGGGDTDPARDTLVIESKEHPVGYSADQCADVAVSNEVVLDGDVGAAPSVDEGANTVFIRVFIHDQNLQRCYKFHLDEVVFNAKRKVLSTLVKDLKDSLNYGFFQPPQNFKAGKFLHEDRLLREYPLPDKPIGYLEFKYKRRVYKTHHIDERCHRQLHAKANLKRFLGYVTQGSLEKVAKLTEKGLDPNFQDPDTGESPLTVCASLRDDAVCRDMILALVNGGAHLDYRARDGATPMHRVVALGNRAATKVLLELGASPNYKDSKGLSPVHYAISAEVHPDCLGLLLHDRAQVGTPDPQGWFEVHNACRFGLPRHLELLLLYGADMHARNDSGMTSLHICALNGQESCARLLLLRGADKSSQNYANHTPSQVAIISGNDALAEIIRNHNDSDVLPFSGTPKFNDKRRSDVDISPALVRGLSRTNSLSRLDRLTLNPPAPPSPSPSQHSLPHFITGSNSSRCSSPNVNHLSRLACPEGAKKDASPQSSSGSSGKGSSIGGSPVTARASSRRRLLESITSSPSKVKSSSPKSLPPTNNKSNPSHNVPSPKTLSANVSKPPLSPPPLSTHKLTVVPSSSSTPHSTPPARNSTSPPTPSRSIQPPCTGICTKSYSPLKSGEIRLNRGDFVKIVEVDKQTGFYNGQVLRADLGLVQTGLFPSHCVEEVQLRSGVLATSSPSSSQAKVAQPRYESVRVTLRKSRHGYGFILRGPKSHSSRLEHFRPTAEMPALQYIDVVDEGSAAEEAELRPGDFIVGINAESVVNASHEYTVKQIKKSGACVTIEILRPAEETTPPPPTTTHLPVDNEGSAPPSEQQLFTLQQRLSAPEHGLESTNIRGAMTLPSRTRHSIADSSPVSNGEGSRGGIPRRPSTSSTISAGRGDGGSLGGMAKFASIKGRHRLSSQRISATELEAIMARHGAPKVDIANASASNQAKPVIVVPPFHGSGNQAPPMARTSISEEDESEKEAEVFAEPDKNRDSKSSGNASETKETVELSDDKEEKVRGEGDGSEMGNALIIETEKLDGDEIDKEPEVASPSGFKPDESNNRLNETPCHTEITPTETKENNSITKAQAKESKTEVNQDDQNVTKIPTIEEIIVDDKSKANQELPMDEVSVVNPLTPIPDVAENAPSTNGNVKGRTSSAEFDVVAFEAARNATKQAEERERLSRLTPRAVTVKKPLPSTALANLATTRSDSLERESVTSTPPPPPPPPPLLEDSEKTTPSSPLPPPPPPFRILSQEEKMREFERRMANMNLIQSPAAGESNSPDYLSTVGQTGTLPAQFRHAAVVRPMGKPQTLLQQSVQTPQRRSSLTSQSGSQQSPLVEGIAYYSPNVKNISAFGTLSALQSQHMRQALSQRLSTPNPPTVNGNNNPRLNMRVMSPPVAGSRAAAGKQQEAITGHQRSKSVPRKASSEVLSFDNYGTSVVGPQLHRQHLHQQQQQAQFLAHHYPLYGDSYHYRAGTLPYEVNGYAAPGVNYIVYDNPYGSLARPSAPTRQKAPGVATYGTLPSKGTVGQQQWRRQSELVYHPAASYPVPIIYDAATGAYFAADPVATQMTAPGLPIWNETEQAFVTSGIDARAYAQPNQLSYVVDPVIGSKPQIPNRVPGRQVFIPQPDYPVDDNVTVNANELNEKPKQQRLPQKILPQQPQQNTPQQITPQQQCPTGAKKKSVTFAPFLTEASPEGTQTEKYSKIPFQNNAEFVELDSIQL